jgi:3-dehydroquinate synthase
MATVDIAFDGRSYPVIIGRDLLGQPDRWRGLLKGSRTLVVTNDVVGPLYLDRVLEALPEDNRHSLVLPDGEANKNQRLWWWIIDELVAIGADRDSCIIALGGGVIGDLGGFAAASYMRGIDFIQVPTTLLAQVDAAVGGKTGINHEQGKNLVGAFHQPRAVLMDTDTLDTLPEREFLAGLAEVVKYGAIRDRPFLEWLERHATRVVKRDREILAELVERSVSNKAEVVTGDEFEAGARALLNFGHSFGHALETLTGYQRYLHGEAVAIGMVVAARLSEARGLCVPGSADRLAALLEMFGLPVTVLEDVTAAAVVDQLRHDKKMRSGRTRLVLLEEFGSATIDDTSRPEQIVEAIEACR